MKSQLEISNIATGLQSKLHSAQETLKAQLNDMTQILESLSPEDAQSVMEVFGTDALAYFSAGKALGRGLIESGVTYNELRSDFAEPEMADGSPTGKLIYVPPTEDDADDVEPVESDGTGSNAEVVDAN